jgi:hypothetical protein
MFGIEGINVNRVDLSGRLADEKPLEQMDFANLEATEFVVYAVPQKTGSYDFFLNNLRILTEPIPRALWPDKPLGEPVRIFYLYDYGNFIAMALGLPAVGWYSLGYLGVAIWSAFFAWIYGAAYRGFAGGRQSNVSVMSYAFIFSTTILAFRDGMLITIAKLALPYFFPIVLLTLLLRLMSPALLKSPREAPVLSGIVAPTSRQASEQVKRSERARARSRIAVPRAWRGSTVR